MIVLPQSHLLRAHVRCGHTVNVDYASVGLIKLGDDDGRRRYREKVSAQKGGGDRKEEERLHS